MRKVSVFLLCLLLLGLTGIKESHGLSLLAEDGGGWVNYKGAWFEIKYPGHFTVRSSIKSPSASEGYDSAFFSSDDGSVEFYVYSPLWTGYPADIELKADREELAAQKEDKKGGRIVRFVTIKAKDNSYLRSFVDTQNTEQNTRLVFGIKYRSQKDYDRNKDLYLKFKGSIKQYAD
jgi:hypothetical protein